MAKKRKAPRKDASAGKSNSKRSRRRPAGRYVALAVAVAVTACLLLTAYAGEVSPLNHSAWWGVLPLAFPIFFWLTLGLTALFLFVCRRAAAVLVAGLLLCAGPALAYCPLHIAVPAVPADAPRFTLMSYNVMGMCGQKSTPLADGQPNPTLQYIIDSDADIVCLQECKALSASSLLHITSEQLDSLHSRYAHVCLGAGNGQTLLSKYPVENIHLDSAAVRGARISAYRITLPCQRRVTVFNIHLHTMGLSGDIIAEGASADVDAARTIVGRLRSAGIGRARQVNKLMQVIRTYGGPDVIVCGDFNDVTGCHAMRTLSEAGFRDAYGRTGLGPLVTYNYAHLWFAIDHILSRGDLQPLSVHAGRLRYSDHYPLTTTFAVDD